MPSELTTPKEWAIQLLEVAQGATPTTIGGEITRSFRTPGLPVPDCCPQLTVHLSGAGLLPTKTGPGGLSPGHRRTVGMVRFVRYTITVFRCAPTPNEDGTPPAISVQEAIADIVEEDVWAIVDAVVKADAAGTLFGGKCSEFYFDGATSLDPQGGCVGWIIHFRAAMQGLVG